MLALRKAIDRDCQRWLLYQEFLTHPSTPLFYKTSNKMKIKNNSPPYFYLNQQKIMKSLLFSEP